MATIGEIAQLGYTTGAHVKCTMVHHKTSDSLRMTGAEVGAIVEGVLNIENDKRGELTTFTVKQLGGKYTRMYFNHFHGLPTIISVTDARAIIMNDSNGVCLIELLQ